jgi:PleD family two-component response regulator
MSEILLAEDDDSLREMVAATLRAAGYQVRQARDGAEALREVRRAEPDILVLDYRMGTPNGFEVCRDVKSDPRLAHLPVLILTAQSGVEDRLQGFDAGADDYLAKPFDPRELVARVGALLRLARQGLERNPTTRLPGGESIHAEIDRWRARGRPFAVCYFDLDHFKPFADRFGFATADAVIQEVGKIMREIGERPGVFVGHVGGDDFVLLCAPEEARALAAGARESLRGRLERIVGAEAARLRSYRGPDREGVEREFPLTTLSAAIVHVDPARWSSLEHLGEQVAEAKRRAKRSGSDGITEAELAPP